MSQSILSWYFRFNDLSKIQVAGGAIITMERAGVRVWWKIPMLTLLIMLRKWQSDS